MLNNSEVTLYRTGVDIRQPVDIILTVLKPIVEQKEVNLVADIPDTIPLVDAEEIRLEQILYNLVGNSIRFTDSGSIRIKAVQKGAKVKISVVDTGIGIPVEKQSIIFNSFEQANNGSDRKHAGTGLGLSITKNLVELHGGHISVESSPGSGSEFSFDLPVFTGERLSPSYSTPAVRVETESSDGLSESHRYLPVPGLELDQQEASLQQPIESSDPGVHELAGVSILAVDDDAVNLQVIKNILSIAEAQVTVVQSGADCLETLEQIYPDIILLDIMMPEMNGYRTA